MGAGLDPDRFERMLDDPNFIQQMNEMMDNPMVQQMILDSPQMRDNPIARQMIQNRDLRRMMFNPDFMRAQMRMQQQMNRDRDRNNFPAPGTTDNTGEGEGQEGQPNQTPNASSPPPNPFLMGMPPLGQAGANPFASLFGGMPPAQPPTGGTGTNAASGDSTSNTTSTAENNPMQDYLRTMMGARTAGPNNDQLGAMTRLMQNPDFLQLAGSMYGTNPPNLADMGAFGAGGLGGLGGAGGTTGTPGTGATGDFANPFFPFGQMPAAPQSPPDTRPPEERYAEQLRQLNDMGFFDFDRNVEALRRTGGSVQGAVEYLLSHS
jgi:ubiquilin